MNRLLMRFYILASCLLMSGALGHAERPNIVLILCDDLGYADVGFNGAKDIVTPQLDRLAKGGTIFTSAYVTHPFCGPSRMGLMAGRYPHSFGAPYNLPNSGFGIEEYNHKGIDVHETLISTTLQNSGYYTGAIGKWHMGYDKPFHPNTRGFDDFYGFLGGGHQYFPEKYRPIYERQIRAKKPYINDYIAPLEHNGNDVKETEYITDALSREASRFVKEASARKKPFFLYLAYNAPHSPLEAKDTDLAHFGEIKDLKRRTYAAMVYAVDRGVGRLVETLKNTNEFDDTLIVFLSDNGGKLSLGANNGPLREGKGSTHEGGYRIPMFFHWPGNVPAGVRYNHPVTALDFYPTFAKLGSAALPQDKQLDGKDIWADLLAGRSARNGEMIFAMRHRDGFSDVGARRDQWKVCRTNNAGWKLFNLDDDIGENKDLSKEHPERVREMVGEVAKWSVSHTAPRWFDSEKVRDGWIKAQMPKFESTFQVD